tara:strand:+ start:703 stop:1074 length:372 start_codon:yes stop_codon:yes gene_type:complete
MKDKYVTVRVKLSVAKGLNDYQPPCPSSGEVWKYTYPSGSYRNCIAVSLPYADNGACMIALSGLVESEFRFAYHSNKIEKTLSRPEVICITDAGEGLMKLGEKMEDMAGEWVKVGNMESHLKL